MNPFSRFSLLAAVATVSLTMQAPLAAVEKSAVVETYAEIVHATYEDSLVLAQDLQKAIGAFVEKPTALRLGAARKAWLHSREPYGQTEAFRFYAGPIDNDDGPEGLLNAWPLDEAYIDKTVDQPAAGIVANTKAYPEISKALIESLNEKDGDANIATGYHAIEFLLWGQDLNNDPTAAGLRPVSDFTTADNAARRLQYLTVATELLIDHLQDMVDAWAPGKDNYRGAFVKDPDTAIANIIVGVGSLSGGELAGERMAVALANRDQEDEHSCFSDNTHRDIVTNFVGIDNAVRGFYARSNGSTIEGPSLLALIKSANGKLAGEIDSALSDSHASVNAILPPFDHEIQDPMGRKRVQAAIDNLWTLARLFGKVGPALNIEVEIDGL